MKKVFAIVGFLGVALTAQLTVLYENTISISLTDPTQLGRLSRNGVAQDWTGVEAFPGVINTTTTYHYETFTINTTQATFIQIDADSLSPNLFIAAYLGSYAPNSAGAPNLGFDTNWLGDPGTSGNFFGGTDPVFFQVVTPANANLVVVISNTGAANAGVGDSMHFIVEGFIDNQFTDIPDTPEPASTYLLGGGIGVVGLLQKLRNRKSRA